MFTILILFKILPANCFPYNKGFSGAIFLKTNFRQETIF